MRNFRIILLLVPLALVGCGQDVKFDQNKKIGDPGQEVPVPVPGEVVSKSLVDSFPYSWTYDQFAQPTYNENVVDVKFQVFDKDGDTIKDLEKDDFTVEENTSDVPQFDLNANSVNNGQKVDIVFALDITGSMDEEINSVKQNVSDFVNELASKNVDARLCLLTYKDDIRQKCDRYVMDDPNTMENENLVDFLDQISRVSVGGGGDIKENTLGAVLSAAKDTPWTNGSQRMIITFTDAAFWVKPDDTNSEARHAPTYQDTLDEITNAQAQIFLVGPKVNGYHRDFKFYDSLPKHGNGQFFDIRDLRKGKITIDDIFNYIKDQIQTTYSIKYVVEDNGLDPTITISQRKLKVKVKSGKGADKVRIKKKGSNMPTGRPEEKKRFVLNRNQSIKPETLSVLVDGNPVTTGFVLDSGDLIFDEAPHQGATLEVQYELGSLIDNVTLHPITLDSEGKLKEILVHFNGLHADEDNYKISQANDGTYHLQIDPSTFDDDDPYKIREFEKLEITVDYKLFVPDEIPD